MAYNDDDFPDVWDSTERELYDDLVLGEPEMIHDTHLQNLFDTALFDMGVDPAVREAALNDLDIYLFNEYGIDFDDEFDWEGYREWYDSQ